MSDPQICSRVLCPLGGCPRHAQNAFDGNDASTTYQATDLHGTASCAWVYSADKDDEE